MAHSAVLPQTKLFVGSAGAIVCGSGTLLKILIELVERTVWVDRVTVELGTNGAAKILG